MNADGRAALRAAFERILVADLDVETRLDALVGVVERHVLVVRAAPPTQNSVASDGSPAIISVKEIAERTGRKPSAVYAWAARGDIPGRLAIGSSVRFSRSIVESWLRGQHDLRDSVMS